MLITCFQSKSMLRTNWDDSDILAVQNEFDWWKYYLIFIPDIYDSKQFLINNISDFISGHILVNIPKMPFVEIFYLMNE